MRLLKEDSFVSYDWETCACKAAMIFFNVSFEIFAPFSTKDHNTYLQQIQKEYGSKTSLKGTFLKEPNHFQICNLKFQNDYIFSPLKFFLIDIFTKSQKYRESNNIILRLKHMHTSWKWKLPVTLNIQLWDMSIYAYIQPNVSFQKDGRAKGMKDLGKDQSW